MIQCTLQSSAECQFITFKGFSTTFEALNECFLHLLLSKIFIVSDNTCTKVTCKIPSSHNKAIRHTYNSLVWPTIINSTTHIRDKTSILYFVVKYNRIFEGLFESSTFVIHYSSLALSIK